MTARGAQPITVIWRSLAEEQPGSSRVERSRQVRAMRRKHQPSGCAQEGRRALNVPALVEMTDQGGAREASRACWQAIAFQRPEPAGFLEVCRPLAELAPL